MKATRIVETCLYARDLKAAEDFYTRVLGLEVHVHADGRNLFFRCGSAMFLIFNPDVTKEATTPGIPPHGAVGEGHVAFCMGDDEIDAWRARLTEEGVAIESEYTWPSGGFSLYFRDPANNSVELTTLKTWNIPE